MALIHIDVNCTDLCTKILLDTRQKLPARTPPARRCRPRASPRLRPPRRCPPDVAGARTWVARGCGPTARSPGRGTAWRPGWRADDARGTFWLGSGSSTRKEIGHIKKCLTLDNALTLLNDLIVRQPDFDLLYSSYSVYKIVFVIPDLYLYS